jgi:hypothetical protein
VLIYDPALDPYHAAVRMLGILALSGRDSLSAEAVQIIDTVLLYPALLLATTMPKGSANLRKSATVRLNPFRQPPASRPAIDSIQAIQRAAASTLAAAGVLDLARLKLGDISKVQKTIPASLGSAVEHYANTDREYKELTIKALSSIPVRGRDGLKQRTHLMDYRYDQV